MDPLFYILILSIATCIFYGAKGLFLVSSKSQPFKIFMAFNALLGLLLAGLYLFTIELDEDNQFLNLYSLLFFVLCIALPPTFYLYVKSLTRSMADKVALTDSAKHYTPALLLLVINLFAFVFLNIKEENSVFFKYVQNVMEYANLIAMFFILLFQVILYLFLSIVDYRDYSSNYKNLYSYNEGVSLKWILSFIIGFFVFIVMIFLVQLGIPQGNLIFGGSVLFYVVYTNYNALNQEKVYSKLIKEGIKSIKAPEIDMREIKKSIAVTKEDDQENSWLPILLKNLENSMTVDKIYKDTNLNLQYLSNHLESNTKYVSSAINNHFNKNFSSYINEYRINEAISLLSDRDQEQYTLEHIANMSGFKSRSAFISSFKKIKNMTPSQFKKSLEF